MHLLILFTGIVKVKATSTARLYMYRPEDFIFRCVKIKSNKSLIIQYTDKKEKKILLIYKEIQRDRVISHI
jgi:hypothetical protein